jgi:pyruvate dehydrogenase E2 component (dihydrolipoamide acetyltransferase)
MISKVVLAKLSPTMEEGTIVKWNKKEGDPIKQGDILAEIETDKANMEMESLGTGVLRKILVPAGGKAPVGALIGVIADPSEDISGVVQASAPAAAMKPQPSPVPSPQPSPPSPPQPSPAAAAPPRAPEPTPLRPAEPTSMRAPAASPVEAAVVASAKAAPGDQPASLAEASRTVPTPPSPALHPVPSAATSTAPSTGGEAGRVKASPLARTMAAQQNIPLGSISGSGPGGRIIKRDVEAWAAGAQRAALERAAPALVEEAPPAPAVAPGGEIPLSSMRRTIARRLVESKFSAPHFYVTVEIDMGPAMALREQVIEAAETKVSVNDLVVKACARALTRFPMVNATWAEDKIITHGQIDVGVAVALPDGLIAPVVRNADRKSVVEIGRETKDLAARARDRKLKPEEYSSATFTISNLGMMGVTEFTAIINPPGSAILAVGAVRKLAVVVNDQVTVGQRMNVTLSCDHRVVDGALAAQFLAEVRRLLENPIHLLVG